MIVVQKVIPRVEPEGLVFFYLLEGVLKVFNTATFKIQECTRNRFLKASRKLEGYNIEEGLNQLKPFMPEVKLQIVHSLNNA